MTNRPTTLLSLQKPSRNVFAQTAARVLLLAMTVGMFPEPAPAQAPPAGLGSIRPSALFHAAAPAAATTPAAKLETRAASVPAPSPRATVQTPRARVQHAAPPRVAKPTAKSQPKSSSRTTSRTAAAPMTGGFSRSHTIPAGWSLVSVPLQPTNPAASSVFAAVPAPLHVYDYVGGQTLGLGEAGFRPVAPGRADWILLAAPQTVTVAGTGISTAASYSVPLVPGWNAVATPWLVPVSWADAQVSVRNGANTTSLTSAVSQAWIEGNIQDPAPGDTYATIAPNASGELAPWQGYLLYSNISGSLVFSPPPPDTTAPTTSSSSPADGADITAPTDIVGTVDDPNLASWTLAYSKGGSGVFTTFASGTNPVVNGVLGTLDPTLLLNGVYAVRLTATDLAGNSSGTAINVVVRDNMKVGNFSVSFVDLEVPVAGLPIRLTRTYDSREHASGDFGFGWRLDLSRVQVSLAEQPGFGWYGTVAGIQFPTYCLQPTTSHPVTVTLPDGKVYEFDVSVSPQCQGGVPIEAGHVSFVPRPGTIATLSPIGGTDVDIFGSWPGPQDVTQGANTYDPQGYVLTLPDGRSFTIDKQLGLQTVADTNGNSLFISSGGILSSTGKGVTFQRDGAGRIQQIVDPNGHGMTYGYDANGDLASFTDRDTNTTTFAYDPGFPHYLSTINDPLGRTPITNTYDAEGRIDSHQDALGNVIHYTHDIAGRQEIVTDRNGNPRVLVYDDRGNVLSETDQNGNTTTRTFDPLNNLLTETNALGQTTTYTYDAFNNRLTVEDPLHHTTTYTYDSLQKPLTITDPRGKVTTNAYDGAENLLTTQDAAGNSTQYTYDSRGSVLTQTVTVNGVPQVTGYQYDTFGNLTQQTDALNHATTYTYDSNANRLTQTTTRTTASGPETLVTTYVYDNNGRLTQTTDPDGSITKTTYDPLGHQATTIDKLNHTTTYAYDDMGRLETTTYPDGTTEGVTYDPEGRRQTSTDRGGRTTSYTYDKVGRLLTTTYPGNATVTNTYDDAGRLQTTTDARGNVTSYTYDAAGRRKTVTDATSKTTTFGYDQSGNQTSVLDARGNTTTYEYDDVNRRTKTNFPDTGNGATFTQTAYDGLGRRISETDQAGKTTVFGYDALGRLASVKDPNNQTTTYGYDELGNRTRQTDAIGHTTTFAYDKLGRETTRTLPDGTSESKAYDNAGNLQTRTDFQARTTTYGYDLVNRLTSKTYPDSSGVGFTYTPTGRRLTAVDSRGTTTYGYDNRDRLTSLTYPDGRKLTYGYDAQGNRANLTAIVGSSTLVTGYSYDADNRLQTVTDPMSRSYVIGYDANGNRQSLTQPNGTVTSYGYDAINRLTGLGTTGPAGTVQSYAYTLGASGNRTQVQEADGTVKQYTYDNLYRLTGEGVTGPSVAYTATFTYDAVGNRQTQVKAGSVSGSNAYNYDTRDRMLGDGGATYGYDGNGNLTSKSGEATYQWDFENRLVQVTKADGTVIQHKYDVDGNRVQTTTTLPAQAPVTVNYLVDTSGSLSQVVAESTAAGITAYYVRGDDLLSVMRGTGTRFYHADGLGSIRALTDETGHITDTYQYSAFGELLSHTGTDPQPYTFAGEPYEPNSGFSYNRARWMDPRVGRFMGMDPWLGSTYDPPTLHRYTYVRSDPANRIDPTGREDISLAGLATSMAISMTINAIGAYRQDQSLYGVSAALIEGAFEGAALYAVGIAALRLFVRAGRALQVAQGVAKVAQVAENTFGGQLFKGAACVECAIEVAGKLGLPAEIIEGSYESVVASGKDGIVSVFWDVAEAKSHYVVKYGSNIIDRTILENIRLSLRTQILPPALEALAGADTFTIETYSILRTMLYKATVAGAL